MCDPLRRQILPIDSVSIIYHSKKNQYFIITLNQSPATASVLSGGPCSPHGQSSTSISPLFNPCINIHTT